MIHGRLEKHSIVWEAGVHKSLNLPQDGERTYVAGTQLLAGQSQADVSSGEPNSITWILKRGISTMDICLYLLASDCPLDGHKMDISGVPYPLTLSEPKIHRWYFGKLSGPWE